MLALKRTATTLSTSGSGWSNDVPHGCFEHTNKQIYNNPNAISVSADCGNYNWVCICKRICKRIPYKMKSSGECTDDDGWGYIITPEECGIAATVFHYSNNPGEDFPNQQANSATYPDYCWLYVQSSIPIIPDTGPYPVKFNTVPSTGNCGTGSGWIWTVKRK
jgi:hypothetical protein